MKCVGVGCCHVLLNDFGDRQRVLTPSCRMPCACRNKNDRSTIYKFRKDTAVRIVDDINGINTNLLLIDFGLNEIRLKLRKN